LIRKAPQIEVFFYVGYLAKVYCRVVMVSKAYIWHYNGLFYLSFILLRTVDAYSYSWNLWHLYGWYRRNR